LSAPDASKLDFMYGGTHAAEVLRKQWVGLAALGLLGPVSEKEDDLGILVGVGDSNVMYLATNALKIDVRQVHMPNFLRADFLKEDIAVKGKRVFSDAFCSIDDADAYWRKVYNEPPRNGAQLAGAKASEILYGTAFDQSAVFLHRAVTRGAQSFCVKLILDPSAKSFGYLAEVAKQYNLYYTPGGRGHNAEIFLLGLPSAITNRAIPTLPMLSKSFLRVYELALEVSVHRMCNELSLSSNPYDCPGWAKGWSHIPTLKVIPYAEEKMQEVLLVSHKLSMLPDAPPEAPPDDELEQGVDYGGDDGF